MAGTDLATLTFFTALRPVAVRRATFKLTWFDIGAATLGCLAGTALAAGLTLAVAMREYRLRPQWGAWGRVLVATAAMSGALALVPWGTGGVALTAEILAGVTIYGAVMAVLFPGERRLLITKLRRRTG